MKGYWFSKEDGTTEHLKDPAEVGKVHDAPPVDSGGNLGPIVPCERGYHASPTPWDALQYACGPILYEVEIPDDAIPHGNPISKYAAKSRRYLRKVDLTAVCRQFAVQQALEVIDLWKPPDIVREYLGDEAEGKDRSDIRAAAWAARTCFNNMALAAFEGATGDA